MPADLRCECCGSRVRIVSSGEGACRYTPALPELPALLARGVEAIRRDGAYNAVDGLEHADRKELRAAAAWLLGPAIYSSDDAMLVFGACAALAKLLPEESRAGVGGCPRCRVLETQNQRLFEERSRVPVAMLADLMAAIRDAGGALRISRESLGDALHALADDALHVTREETPEGIELTLAEELE